MRREWRTYQVPARENDAAEGRQWTDVRADEMMGCEFATLSPADQDEAWADLAEMDAIAAACEVDAPYAFRDGECAVRRTDPPESMAAE